MFELRSGSLKNCTIKGNGLGYGVLVAGSDATLEGVRVENGLRGVQVEHCNRVTITNCTACQCVQFGFNAEYADSITFDQCSGQYNGLDGFKLRAKATNITFRNCTGMYNGQDPKSAGDGIDVYGGGNGVLIDGGNFSHNLGNGLTLKTDTGNRDEPNVYGMVQNLTVRGAVCTHNTGWGIIAISGFVPDVPLLQHVTIEATTCQNNIMDGLLVNAGDVIVDGLNAEPNGRYGVMIDTRSVDVQLTGVAGTVHDLR